jgi:two-component system, chemotaxis family, protein-glutamate methylesterase/glutaminase
VNGLVDLYESGALTLAQHPASCAAYALPKAAIEAGAVDKQLSCEAIATEILEYCDAGKLERYHV